MRIQHLSLAAVLVGFAALTTAEITPDKMKKIEKAKMSDKELAKVQKMHSTWYAMAVNGLLSAVAHDVYSASSLDTPTRKALVACLDRITEEDALTEGARCLSRAWDGTLLHAQADEIHDSRYDFLDGKDGKKVGKGGKVSKRRKTKKKTSSTPVAIPAVMTTTPSPFIQLPSEPSPSPSPSPSPFVQERLISTGLRKEPRRLRFNKYRKYGKYHHRSQFARRAKRDVYDDDGSTVYSTGRRTEKRRVKKLEHVPNLMDAKGGIVAQGSSMIKNIVKIVKKEDLDTDISFAQTRQRIEELQRAQVKAKDEHGYRKRMLDTVLGHDHPLKEALPLSAKPSAEFKRLLPKELKPLGDLLTKTFDVDKEGRNRVLSPRFMPLFPQKVVRDSDKLLSPDIMPMYRVPALLNSTGMEKQDRDGILQLIIESSGTLDIIDEAMGALNKTRQTGMGEDVTAVTELMAKTFKDLKGMFHPEQTRMMDKRKFAFATGSQLKKLYGNDSIFNIGDQGMPFDVDEYDAWTHDQKEQALRNTIHLMAEDHEDYKKERQEHIRRKRAIPPTFDFEVVLDNGYKITFYRHATLSPYAFSPAVNTMAVLGPAILSPSIFSPSIASPLLLSPPVLSPQVGNPLILSPYVLGPNVLSAAVFNAYVLSPYVLSPNVVNPYVMSPLILSPFVLCPDVFSPTVLSGAVLSPSIASPAVYTKNALAILVLSPSFLS